MFPTSRPTISTPRILLRPLTMNDAPEVARLAGDRAVAATTLLIPHPYELQHAEGWIATHEDSFAKGQNLSLAICEPSAPNTLVGAIGVTFTPAHKRAELGYWVGVPFWNRGHATEASRALIAWAFANTDLIRICAYHYTKNAASGRVLAKAGMKLEGIARNNIIKWGEPQDCVLYGVLREERIALR